MSKRTLLLADDSVTIQKVVNLTFADEGIDVITVGDGDSAMKKISEASPDVILADVHMPGLSGYQICEMVRANPATRELPVVLLVGSFEPFDEGEAARVGASAYLTKPFQSIRQLVAQVSDLMEVSVGRTSEPEKEDDADSEAFVPDTTDIDSLYQRSVSEPGTEAEGESGPPRYVDAGMDDEMIETVHADDDADRVTDSDVSEGQGVTEGVAENAFAYEAAAGTAEPSITTAEHVDREHPFDEFSATEPLLTSFEIPEPEDRPYSTTARLTQEDFDLDGIELLELPPVDSGNTLEFTTNPDLGQQGGQKQVVSLSPELMEIIIEKVVAKLSEKR